MGETFQGHNPPWLSAKVDQRLAAMRETLGVQGLRAMQGQYDVVMTTLTEPPVECTDEEFEKWNRQCDNCGRVPEKILAGETKGVIKIDVPAIEIEVLLIMGACPECMGIEA